MISSTSNKQVKFVQALLKKAKTRREEDLFVAEGQRMCMEIPKSRIRTLFISESFQKNRDCGKLTAGVRQVELVSDDVFKAMADTQTPQGVLALVKQYHYSLDEVLKNKVDGKESLFMVLDTLQDPGNLGTILRAGEGAGISGIIMNDKTADIYNPKVIRSTMGSVLRVPFVYTEDLSGTLTQMKSQGITLYAAHLEAKYNYEACDYKKSSAFLIGNEAKGLSEEIAKLADTYIRIPMVGQVESLNAAVASSVLMFEAARQRRL